MKIQRAVYRYFLRPILFKTCPEFAHDIVKKTAQILQAIPGGTWFLSALYEYKDEILNTTVDGVDYANPLLISAGFDKTGILPPVVHNLGFGGIELGSFSKYQHDGNPGVRLWRAVNSQSINVWYGLNNDGSEYVSKHVAPQWAKAQAVIGVSGSATNGVIGEADATDDLLTTYERLGGFGDYFTINLSCPNLGVDNPYYDLGNLERLLKAVRIVRSQNGWDTRPVYCKIGPDHSDNEICHFIDIMHKHGVDGILTCNLTKNRRLVPEDDRTTHVISGFEYQTRVMPYDRGGMSGSLLRPMTNHITRVCGQHVKDRGYNFTIISIGGCDSAEDAYLKIRSGASLIHLITSMIFHGPQIGKEINKGLAELIKRDGFNSVAEAVGADLD
jgi:dihydroorotate dehydrogenase